MVKNHSENRIPRSTEIAFHTMSAITMSRLSNCGSLETELMLYIQISKVSHEI